MPARQFCRMSRNTNPIARLLIPSSWMASPGWHVGSATATPSQTNAEHSRCQSPEATQCCCDVCSANCCNDRRMRTSSCSTRSARSRSRSASLPMK